MDYSFGEWVKRRRKALDITQQELARRVGCSHSAIFKIESDERRPSRQIAELLAAHLEIPPDQHAHFLKVARRERSVDGLDGIAPSPVPETALPPSPAPGFLPISPNPLIGRDHEISIVVKNLQDPACRLLTLTGPGGVGKTRLAIDIAGHLKPNFPDGVFFLAMAGVDLPESIIPVIADELGLSFSGPADPKFQIINSLRKKKILLVIDNFEHLLAGAGILGEILEQAPHIRMLLTSREQINLKWEWIFEVQGLPIPEEANLRSIETNSAAALFIQRARQVSREFSLDQVDATAVARICKLVDGLPLALELAASWVRTLSCKEIADELERSLDFLETTKQDIPARHRSIKSVFDYSWRLLTGIEQALLMKLSVFQGGFTREAATSVAGASLPLLSSLIGKSLLRHSRKSDRYDLHELIRQYAAAQLQANPDAQAQALENHAQYYADWLADREIMFKSPLQVEMSVEIRTETGNWRSAWQWAVQRGRLDLVRSVIPCLSWYFEVHGYYADALSMARFALNKLRKNGAPANLSLPADISTYAFLLDQVGWFEFRTGNLETAELLFAEALELAAKVGDQEVLYYIHGNWGYLALLKGDVAEAERLTLESLANARVLNSEWHIAIPANVLGIVDYQQGKIQESYEQLTNSLKLWRTVGDPRGLSFCMLYLGATAQALGKTEMAISILNESNAIAKNKMDHWAEAFGLDVLGQVFHSQGRYAQAREQFRQSLALSHAIGDLWGSTKTLIHLGEAQMALQFDEDTRQLFLVAYMNARQAKWPALILEVLVVFLSIDSDTPLEEKLAATLSILMDSIQAPHIRTKAELLRDQLVSRLTAEQVEWAKSHALEKSPEAWAEAILK